MRKWGNWKHLSSKKVITVLFLNLVVLSAIVFGFGIWLNHSRALFLKDSVIGALTYRELALCFIFAGIINSVIDYYTIIAPMWNLEEKIQKHEETVRSEDFLYNSANSGLSIETALQELLNQQKLMYDKKRIEEKQRRKAQLYALQTQIDPHFLYNALDSIRGYALLHDMEEISDITEALSRVFRNMISDKHELLPFWQEMDNISNYMKIQQFRFNHKFQYFFDIDEEIVNKYMVPRMVIQPLVENAIVHGLEKKVEGGWVKVTAYVTERRLVITVTDNGVGMSEERLELLNKAMEMGLEEYDIQGGRQHAGIALININKRIKLNFGNRYGLILNSTQNVMTSTEVILPLLINRE